jgi:hypothetical protein
MHKVIVERPRRNPGPGKKGRRDNLPDELLPKCEGIKRSHRCRKGLTDLLGPLKRWLQSQVGRPWNDVYSEACAVIKPDSIVRAHIKTHLLEFVERHTFMHEGKVCVLDTGYLGRGVIPVTGRRYGRSRFFVHPESGLLCVISQKSRNAWRAEERARRAEHFRWLDDNVALKQIGGIWFLCRFRTVPPRGPFKAYDYAAGQIVGRGGLHWRDGQYLHCIAKRQLSRRELTTYGLRNASAPSVQSSIGYSRCRLKTALCIPSVRAARFQPSTLEVVWQINRSIRTARFFETMSKRRKGFPSETSVKRGFRVVHGNKEFQEKLGRNDLCPCASGRSF